MINGAIPMGSADHVVIIHSAALGDFVLTWPIALAAQALGSSARVTYITQHSKGQLARRFLHCEHVDIELAGLHRLYGGRPALHPTVEAMLRTATRVIDFACGDALAAVCPASALVHLPVKPPPDWQEHVVAFYASRLPPELAGGVHDAMGRLGVNGLEKDHASGRILIHPGSGSVGKNWPLDRFVTVARALQADGRETAWILGEAELERFKPRQHEQLAHIAPILTPSDCLELANDLLTASTLITNDNGPGHLAGMLGLEVISLFGPTSPAIWRPLGPRTHVVQAETLDAITPEQVLALFNIPRTGTSDERRILPPSSL